MKIKTYVIGGDFHPLFIPSRHFLNTNSRMQRHSFHIHHFPRFITVILSLIIHRRWHGWEELWFTTFAPVVDKRLTALSTLRWVVIVGRGRWSRFLAFVMPWFSGCWHWRRHRSCTKLSSEPFLSELFQFAGGALLKVYLFVNRVLTSPSPEFSKNRTSQTKTSQNRMASILNFADVPWRRKEEKKLNHKVKRNSIFTEFFGGSGKFTEYLSISLLVYYLFF